MLKPLLTWAVCLALGCAARAAVYSVNWDLEGGAIPDGNAVGFANSQTVTGLGSSIQDVNVTLNVSGGWNGDLYAYLVHDGGFAVLLNRPGRTVEAPFGYADAGLSVRLDDAAVNGDIHLYGGAGGDPLTGAWRPDGRNADPAAVTDATTPVAFLSAFSGLNPNGSWTIYFADLSGGSQSTLVSWGLEIQTVPEPINVALCVFGAGCGVANLCRILRGRMRFGRAVKPAA